MRNICKNFGSVQALRNVDFRVEDNEIVGLVGDNGAGKTTLINILTGVYPPDKGDIFYKGEKVEFSSPADAIELGITTVHQRGGTIKEMNIRENFFLGREITKSIGPISWLDKKKMDQACMGALRDLGISIDSPNRNIETLSGGETQAVSIGRCMYFGGELFILDEPTAALSLKETDKVLKQIAKAKEMGFSIVLISHLTRHVYPVADRFTILDSGRKIRDVKKEKISRKELEQTIVSGRLTE